MTPIDEQHFRPDPAGKRTFVLDGGPAADIGTKHEFDLARSQAGSPHGAVRVEVAYEPAALAVLPAALAVLS